MARVYDFVAETKDKVDESDTNRVDVHEGFITISQSNAYGEDGIYSISPEDARWFAKQLAEAAAVASKHRRWCSDGHIINIKTGRCVNCNEKCT